MLQKGVLLVWAARRRLKLTWALMKDRRVPLWQKAIPVLPLLYIFSPLNFLTLSIPLVGQFDDIMLVVLALNLFERLVDQDIVNEYRK